MVFKLFLLSVGQFFFLRYFVRIMKDSFASIASPFMPLEYLEASSKNARQTWLYLFYLWQVKDG